MIIFNQFSISMTPNELNDIEHKLCITLPTAYKKLMARYPFHADSVHYLARQSLLDSTEAVITINRFYRQQGYQHKLWPHNFFIIGMANGYALLFINLQAKHSPVYSLYEEDQFNRNNLRGYVISDNLDELVAMLKRISHELQNETAECVGNVV